MEKNGLEKVLVFHDYANLSRSAADQGIDLDHGHLLGYLGEGRFLVDAHCYVPIDPRNPHVRDREIEALWGQGYLVHTKVGTIAGETYKCNFDVELTLDMIRSAHDIRPDTIVLASGDGDFVPVVLELRRMGIRVEVASFSSSVSRKLLLRCSGHIDLDRYDQEWQGVRELPPATSIGEDHVTEDAETATDRAANRHAEVPDARFYQSCDQNNSTT